MEAGKMGILHDLLIGLSIGLFCFFSGLLAGMIVGLFCLVPQLIESGIIPLT